MRYLSSIFATVFTLIAGVAFYLQLQNYDAPTGQYIAMGYLVVFNLWLWGASIAQQMMAGRYGAAQNEVYYRVISQHNVFPTVIYIVQLLVVVLYFVAYNTETTAQKGLAATLRAVLPSGVFIPLVLGILLAAPGIVFMLINHNANVHTYGLQAQQNYERGQVQSIRSMVMVLGQNMEQAPETQKMYSQIEAYAQSLPLKPNPTTRMFYDQAVSLINEAMVTPQPVTKAELERIYKVISQIR